MSYDYHVYCHTRPDDDTLTDFLASRRRYRLQGSLSGQERYCLVERVTRSNHEPAFTIDGPVSVDESNDEDATGSNWLVEISVPSTANCRDRVLARTLGKHLARACGGKVYDPQKDRFFGSQRPSRLREPVSEQRIPVVNLEWFLPTGECATRGAEELLALLRRLCSEAVPTRYGTFEPLAEELLPGDDEGFLDQVRESSEDPCGDQLFWMASSPCLGGSLSYPDTRVEYRPDRAAGAVRLSMQFNGHLIGEDTRWCDVLLDLFVRIATDFSAFYAAGYVERGLTLREGVLWYGEEAESVALTRGGWWLGIPSTPTWLAWFGGGYRDALASIPGIAKVGTGLLVKTAPRPLDSEQVTKVFPRLPGEYLASYLADDLRGAAKLPPLGSGFRPH